MADKNFQMTQRNAANTGWDNLFPVTKVDNVMDASGNSHMADYIRQPGYGTTGGSANAYTLTLSPALTAYAAGVCVAVKIHAANTGSSTININGLGAKTIKDSKGNALISGKLRLNGVYTLRYDGMDFIQQGEGGEYGTAVAAEVLAGKTIGTDAGIVTGTMPNKVGSSTVITPSGSDQTIPQGYYGGAAGDGKVAAVIVPVANVLSGTTIAGQAGTMPNRGAPAFTPGTTDQGIPAGYYSGGVIKGDADLIESNIRQGIDIFGKVGSLVPNVPFTITASDAPLANMYIQQNNYVNSTTPQQIGVKFKSINITGTVRIRFKLGAEEIEGQPNSVAYGAVFKNDVQVGATRSNSNAAWITFTEDFACAVGDVFSIKVWKQNPNGGNNGAYGYDPVLFANVSIPSYYQTLA